MICANPECGNNLLNKRSDAMFCSKSCKNKKWHLDNKGTISRKQSHNKANSKYYKKNQSKIKEMACDYIKLWRVKNPEKVQNQSRKRINELQRSYLMVRLKRQGITKITPALIEQKRLVLKIKRKIKDYEKQRRSTKSQ